MADNIVANAGVGGATIATDDVASVHYQRVKLVDGTLDSTAAIAGDATNGLDVDVTRVIPGTTATSLGKAEDAAHTTGDVGVMALSVRQDTAAALAGTDADYQPLITDANGRLHTITSLAAAQTLATVTTVSTVTSVTAIANALPAGTNAIGKLAANSGVDIGDIDVTSVIAGTGATNLGKAEDAAHTSGDTGVMALAVRRDANTTLSDATGDYTPLQVDATGSLKVAIISGAGSGGTSITDAAAFTRATTSATPVAGVVETSAPTLTNGNAGTLSLTTGGAVRVSVASGGIAAATEDAAAAGGEEGVMMLAVRRDAASSGVSADGDFAALSVTSDGSLRVSGSSGTTQYAEDVASAGAESLCLMGAVRRDTAASSSGTDGDYSTINVNSAGRLYTSTTIDAALPAGTNGIGKLTANTGVTIGAVEIAAAQTLATVTTVSTVTAVTNVATIGTSVTPGTGAANLGKAEDAAHASGDTGVMALAVRTDTAAASSGTTGDYETLHTDSVGALWNRSTGELADDAAFTPATSRVMPVGYTADETATDSVDEGDIGAARMTLDRKQIVSVYAHAAAGGTSSYTALSTAAVLTAAVKASAGKVFSLQVFNLNAAARYVRLYDMATAPASTDGASIVWRGIIPGDAAGAGFVVQFPAGKQFATGIGLRASAAVADNDTTVLGANELTFNVDYI